MLEKLLMGLSMMWKQLLIDLPTWSWSHIALSIVIVILWLVALFKPPKQKSQTSLVFGMNATNL
ncbi:hypothetical protein KVD52_06065 [Helicobacter pylori]|nr:hypothetical protein KVD52_06065 [Helicobacter pylori]